MQGRGSEYFFGFVAIVLLAIAGWAIYRMIVVERVAISGEVTPVLPRTTQAVADLSESHD